MSAKLCWRPREGWKQAGGAMLRDAISNEFGNGVLDSRSFSFLKVLRAAGISGAQELMEAIETLGEIEVEVQN